MVNIPFAGAPLAVKANVMDRTIRKPGQTAAGEPWAGLPLKG